MYFVDIVCLVTDRNWILIWLYYNLHFYIFYPSFDKYFEILLLISFPHLPARRIVEGYDKGFMLFHVIGEYWEHSAFV